MGQKVNPISMRLGINRTWDSTWYAGKNEYSVLLKEDLNMRKMIFSDLKNAAISRVVIERPHKKCLVTIHSGRPGLIIGKKGSEIENLRKKLQKLSIKNFYLTHKFVTTLMDNYRSEKLSYLKRINYLIFLIILILTLALQNQPQQYFL